MSSLRRYIKTEGNWRSAVWNRWLISYLTPKHADAHCTGDGESARVDSANCGSNAVDPSAPAVASGKAAETAAAQTAEPACDVRAAADVADVRDGAASFNVRAERISTAPPSSDDFAQVGDTATAEQWAYRRRALTRARLEALNDQVSHVQDSIDGLADRLERERLREQRRLLRLEQLVESTAGATERQATLLDGIVERLERLERRLGLVAASIVPPPRHESVAPKPSFFRPSTAPGRGEDDESPPESGPHGRGVQESTAYRADDPSVSGTLSEISLATILSMFELEQRTGRLSLTCRSLPRVSFDLLDGVVVGSLINEEEVDPVGALQRALEWQDGRFTFCHGAVVANSAYPRSVGSLLLEATRRNDEAVR